MLLRLAISGADQDLRRFGGIVFGIEGLLSEEDGAVAGCVRGAEEGCQAGEELYGKSKP